MQLPKRLLVIPLVLGAATLPLRTAHAQKAIPPSVRSGTSTLGVAGPAAPLFADDFESYALGSFPNAGGWQQFFGNSPGAVVAAGGMGQAFQLIGSSCWAAVAYRPMALSTRVRYEVSVLIPAISQPGCGTDMVQVGFWDPPSAGYPWGYSADFIHFAPNGGIYVWGTAGVFLQTYAPNTWYRIGLEADFVSGTFDVEIDGVRYPGFSGTTTIPGGIGFYAGHGANPNPAPLFDDVSVDTLGEYTEMAPEFSCEYTLVDLGPIGGVQSPYGGITFEHNDPDKLLIGGDAGLSGANIYACDVVRDVDGHITGFSSVAVKSTAWQIDGGLAFEPSGVLFFSAASAGGSYWVGQIEPGSSSEDRWDDLAAWGVTAGGGGLTIVPPGFAGAGRLKLTSYYSGDWYDAQIAPDGAGTFNIVNVTNVPAGGAGLQGPEGMAYLQSTYPLLSSDSVLISEYDAHEVALFDTDAFGDPIPSSRRTFLSMYGPEGITVDPLTGDVLLSSWLLGRVYRVSASAHAATTYCTAGISASGCQATISATGTPSATVPTGFALDVTNVEGLGNGLFFFGSNGRQANSWGNGTSYQCVVPPVVRTDLMLGTGTGGACDGTFSRDLNAVWCPTCPSSQKNPGAGAVVQAQFWYRDPFNTSNQTTSLSDAIEFCVRP